MRGLFLKVRVSVFTPFWFVVVISELSGAVVVAVSVPALALAFVVSLLEQPAPSAASAAIAPQIKILLITGLPPSTLYPSHSARNMPAFPSR
jgi:hypothetical protein